jgi:hypothetical protein
MRRPEPDSPLCLRLEQYEVVFLMFRKPANRDFLAAGIPDHIGARAVAASLSAVTVVNQGRETWPFKELDTFR